MDGNRHWKRFRIIVNSESDFRVQGSTNPAPVPAIPDGEWLEMHRASRWSEAITVYRKMVDGNWTFA